jgi:hypothetical protein
VTKPDEFNVQLIVELKSPGQVLCDSKVGQLLDYLTVAMQRQSSRSRMFGMLTNGIEVVFVVSRRLSEQELAFHRSPVVAFRESAHYFAVLFNSSLEHLGADFRYVSDTRVEVIKKLRKGATCAAYLGRLQGSCDRVILKEYNDLRRVQKEQTMLSTMQHFMVVGCKTPEVVCTGLPNTAHLVVKPHAKFFRLESGRHILYHHVNALLRSLQKVHQVGFIHRDIRIVNFFLLDDCDVLLNDWGSAAAHTLTMVNFIRSVHLTAR